VMDLICRGEVVDGKTLVALSFLQCCGGGPRNPMPTR
jgi:hypothetical protein